MAVRMPGSEENAPDAAASRHRGDASAGGPSTIRAELRSWKVNAKSVLHTGQLDRLQLLEIRDDELVASGARSAAPTNGEIDEDLVQVHRATDRLPNVLRLDLAALPQAFGEIVDEHVLAVRAAQLPQDGREHVSRLDPEVEGGAQAGIHVEQGGEAVLMPQDSLPDPDRPRRRREMARDPVDPALPLAPRVRGAGAQADVAGEDVVVGPAQGATRVRELRELRVDLFNQPVGVVARLAEMLPVLRLKDDIAVPCASADLTASFKGRLSSPIGAGPINLHATAADGDRKGLDEALERLGRESGEVVCHTPV